MKSLDANKFMMFEQEPKTKCLKFIHILMHRDFEEQGTRSTNHCIAAPARSWTKMSWMWTMLLWSTTWLTAWLPTWVLPCCTHTALGSALQHLDGRNADLCRWAGPPHRYTHPACALWLRWLTSWWTCHCSTGSNLPSTTRHMHTRKSQGRTKKLCNTCATLSVVLYKNTDRTCPTNGKCSSSSMYPPMYSCVVISGYRISPDWSVEDPARRLIARKITGCRL